jgi:antitoxin VapB
MSSVAKIFMHGRSQAVRLPKAFRLPGKEARIRKIGKRLILEPIEPGSPAMPWKEIDAIGDRPFMPQGREQPELPTDERLFDE